MKYLAYLLLLFSLPLVKTYGQILHLDMDKGQNETIVKDKSGYNYNGKLHNLTFVPDRFGIDCRALEFDGTGYIEVLNSTNFNLNQNFSVSVWLKLPTANFQWLTLICKGESPQESRISPAYRVQLTSATISYNFPSTKEIGSLSPQVYPQNQWFHLCFVKEGSELRVYQDGQLYSTFHSYSQIHNNTGKLNIGRDIPGNTEFFVGIMDDLCLYDKALSINKIKKLANDQSGKRLPSACPKNTPAIDKPENPFEDISVDIPAEEEKTDNPFEDITVNVPVEEPVEEPTEDPKEDKPDDDPWVDVPEIPAEKEDKYDSLKIGDKYNLKNVRFKRSTDIFLSDAYPELKNLLTLMLQHPTLKIELHGHTDNQGSAYQNKVLSGKRVKKVKKYLVDGGVAQERISTQFFGGDKPIADNSQEVTRKLNRRVEVLIISK